MSLWTLTVQNWTVQVLNFMYDLLTSKYGILRFYQIYRNIAPAVRFDSSQLMFCLSVELLWHAILKLVAINKNFSLCIKTAFSILWNIRFFVRERDCFIQLSRRVLVTSSALVWSCFWADSIDRSMSDFWYLSSSVFVRHILSHDRTLAT